MFKIQRCISEGFLLRPGLSNAPLAFHVPIVIVILWRRGLVIDTWLWDQEVPGSSTGCATLKLSSWERLFTCLSSPHSCVKRVPGYNSMLGRRIICNDICNAPQEVEKRTVVGMACRLCKAHRGLFS